jgi:hypothetical protein
MVVDLPPMISFHHKFLGNKIGYPYNKNKKVLTKSQRGSIFLFWHVCCQATLESISKLLQAVIHLL